MNACLKNILLTQKKMAKFFDTTKQNISLHVKNIFKKSELQTDSVVKDFLITATYGKEYKTKFYSQEAIIAVGYRLRTKSVLSSRT